MAMKGYFTFPETPGLESHYRMVVISWTLVKGGGLAPLQRYSRRILRPQSIELFIKEHSEIPTKPNAPNILPQEKRKKKRPPPKQTRIY